MKHILSFLFASLFSFLSFGQTSITYSLTRSMGGGNLSLTEYNLNTSSESMIKTFLPTEIDDHVPETSTYDHQNGQFISLVKDINPTYFIASINTSTGNIDYTYTPLNSATEVTCLEFYNGKVYTLKRPNIGANLQLIEYDLVTGSEAVIKTYLPSEINDYDGEITTIDHQNGKLITLAADQSFNEFVVSLDISTGNIDYSYYSPNNDVFSLESDLGRLFSFTRPIGGGNLELTEILLAISTENTIYTYVPTYFDDFQPETSTFDHVNSKYIVLGSATSSFPQITSFDINTGYISISYVLSNSEPFSLETGGSIPNGINESFGDILSIYPNPVKDKLNVMSYSHIKKIEIVDLAGKLIYHNFEVTSKLNVSQLKSGIYFLTVTTEKESVTTKFIKQ
jgi:hypothetical protein